MSEEFYGRLVVERQQFKKLLEQLLASVNQADLLKQIMILFGYAVQSGPKRHVWFTNACTSILNNTLNKPNGIETVLKAMCDEDFTSPLVWRKLDIVARIIATMNTAYDVTCPQIVQMLQYNEDLIVSNDQLKLYNQFSIATCKHFHQLNPVVFHTHIYNHVIAPLEQMESKNQTTEGNTSSLSLTSSLLMLDRLFSHVDGLPRELLTKYTNLLFFIYFNIHSSPIYIPVKARLENLLLTLWTSFSVEQCAVLLNRCVFQVQCSPGGVKSGEVREDSLDEDDDEEEGGKVSEPYPTTTSLFQDILDFPPGTISISTSGNLSFVETNTPVPDSHDPSSATETVSPVPDSYERYGATVLELMNKHKDKPVATQNLFICLLQNYTKEVFKDDLERNVVNVKLLNDLVQNFQIEQFISANPEHIILFVEYLIKQSISQDKDTDASSPDNTDSLFTALTLLTILMSEQNTPLFSHITPSLESLLNYSTNEEVNILARQVLEQIKAANPSKKRGSKVRRGESYEKAMCDACDPVLPVRGHGMVTLTKLILSGDATAKSNKSQLLCLFMENLSHEDSYLYLSAVEGLAALTAEHADSVVETLTEQFIGQDQRELECRLKLGEVLMRVARHLGEMLVKYKSQFLNAFLHGCKDEDHLMRTSSLSNLAEICRILGYRVGSILSEMFICIKCIMSSDPYPEPRRAAVMVASFLLCALKQEALQVLEPILPELYRTLRHIYDHDLDDRTRLHAQLALEQLNAAVKAFLTPTLPAGFSTLRL
uniref:Transport and Golgi organization protein 6 homolog n=1 Tax=Cacopsylla melanoneura TaxID=428564 RepID=A0A8D8WYK5_9HEMI